VSCTHNLKNCHGERMNRLQEFQSILILPSTEQVKVKISLHKSWRLRRGREFGTTRRAEMSALRAGPSLPAEKFLGIHFCFWWVDPNIYRMWAEGLGYLKISTKTTGRDSNPERPVMCSSFVRKKRKVYLLTYMVYAYKRIKLVVYLLVISPDT